MKLLRIFVYVVLRLISCDIWLIIALPINGIEPFVEWAQYGKVECCSWGNRCYPFYTTIKTARRIWRS